MKSCAERRSIRAVDVFAAVSTVDGVVVQVAGLEGDRFSRNMRKGPLVTSYELPSLLVALVIGGSASVATTAMLLRARVDGAASMTTGTLLVGWIIGEAHPSTSHGS
jgi:hypothetical protein